MIDPYDELPYRCLPIEWSAPERLSLASRLHGGPRARLDGYRLLELGCGDGANLIPLAYHRPHASFVGVDAAGSQIRIAQARCAELGVRNLAFIHADLLDADRELEGRFDYVLANGVFSWISEAARAGMLGMVPRRLAPSGLFCLNYNARPGWNIRGMIRGFLIAQTRAMPGLRGRAEAAKAVCGRLASSFQESGHPYAELMVRELRLVGESDVSYVAHEYLAEHNVAFWRGDFLALVQASGLQYVADADFNYPSGRIPDALEVGLRQHGITGLAIESTVDLLCYRQLHTPIMTAGSFETRPFARDEALSLALASCLAPCDASESGHPMFEHVSGVRVEAKEPEVVQALQRAREAWPDALPLTGLYDDASRFVDDMLLLHRNGLIELRCDEPPGPPVAPDRLWALEARSAGYRTTRHHTRVTAETAEAE